MPIKSAFKRVYVSGLLKSKQKFPKKDRNQQEQVKYHEYGFKFGTEPDIPDLDSQDITNPEKSPGMNKKARKNNMFVN